jgi:NADH-quinone oxidoreductase subunit M
MVYPLLLVPFTTLITVCTIGWYNKADFEVTSNPNSGSSSSVMLITLISLYTNLMYSAVLWKCYPKYSESGLALYPASSWFELYHSLNLPFVILSTAIIIVALLTAWYSAVNKLLFAVLLLVSEICLIGSFACTNLFIFLLFFEASALPIFILIVYCGSPRRERLKAAYYFLFFTLYGSISLLLLILNVYSINQVNFISSAPLSQSGSTAWLLLFIAFAVKIPLFPFHIWLPYAHVEASTSTSIILAALMLKLGGYGLIRYMLPLFSHDLHLHFKPFALLVGVLGTIYGGICAIRQIDLKRQIAFSSISHMSFAIIGVFTLTEAGIKGAIYLMLSHGLTSAALFYLVGVVSDRYHTRSVLAFGGLLGTMPLFSFFLILASLANVGFPGTSGFLPELFVLVAILSSSPLILAPVLLGMFFTAVSTLVTLLRLLFGHVKVYYASSAWTDITKLECFILSTLSIWMLLMGLFDIFANILK